ncbi:MAG: hypothetical protein IT371_26025 [Deltaproteobacteria bacterium]|nr:hypothetical protein [Deltaproteobacteria bacterium]
MLVVSLGFGLGLALAPAARADDNHYQNYLMGDRAAGLGGAFTALSDDGSGIYYNPAGLAEAEHSSISITAAVYGWATRTDRLGNTGVNADDRAFVNYPTTTIWTQRVRKGRPDGVGRIQLAAALLSPSSAVERRRLFYRTDLGGATPAVANVVNMLVSEDDTLWFGLGMGAKVARRVSLGVSVFGTMRNGVRQYHNLTLLTVSQAEGTDDFGLADRADLRFTQWGLVAQAGAVVSATTRLRFGAAFRTPVFQLASSTHLNTIFIDRPNDRLQVSGQELGARFQARQPWKATVGAAYAVPRRWAATLDVSLHGPVGRYAVLEVDPPFTPAEIYPMTKRMVVQVNAGAELYLGRYVPLRAGFFTNLSSWDGGNTFCTREDTSCPTAINPFADGVDRYGVAGSVGFELEQVTFNLGLSYNAGGRTEQLGTYGEMQVRRSFLFALVGGAFRF